MNYGMYISASGALTAMHRMDVYANNLANSNTTAFKPDSILVRPREAARIEDGLTHLPSDEMLERLGAGVLLDRTRTNFKPAPPERTGNPLDAAIRGEGFFVVRAPGADGAELRLTRDGRFTLDSQGRLVQSATGLPVLDEEDNAIYATGRGQAEITPGGEIRQGERVVGRVQIASVPDPQALTKAGDGLYAANQATLDARSAMAPNLAVRALEGSGVDAFLTYKNVTDASGDVAVNTRMMQMHDGLMESAINVFARVGG